jgi:hypothetical protein
MRKLVSVFLLIFMIGCCSIKLPLKQHIVTTSEGTVIMPNYTAFIDYNDYCCIDTFIQSPEAGILISLDSDLLVTFIAIDCYGKIKIGKTIINVTNWK